MWLYRDDAATFFCCEPQVLQGREIATFISQRQTGFVIGEGVYS